VAVKKDTIKYVANLSRIKLKPKEEDLFAKQLSSILDYMDKLNKLDTKNAEPMSHAVSMGNVFRKDVVKDSVSPEEALKNAPDKKGHFFKVPRIIE